MNIIVTVLDENAPSDKYPHWGFSVDFIDDNKIKYFVEYPNFKSCPFDFKKGKKYSFDCSVKQIKSFLSFENKIIRIKNVIELQ
jgi:hypothetical protein